MVTPASAIRLCPQTWPIPGSASTRRAALELCAPGSRKAEVIPSHRETARRHEVSQEVRGLSVGAGVSRRINGSIVKRGKLEM